MKVFVISILILAGSMLYAQSPGNALNFDGSNDMVVIDSVPALFNDITNNSFTIEAWVNPSSIGFQRIVFVQPSTTNFTSMGTGPGNVIYFYVVRGGTTISTATSSSIPQNQWTHVACRWNAATNSANVFFNGILQTGNPGGASSTGTSGLICIGARPGGGTQHFNGSLDEIRIWNVARTECQIQMNLHDEFTSPQTNLVAYYNFNQGIANGINTGVTNLPDINAIYNGVLTNFALTGTNSNWISSGAGINNIGPTNVILGPVLSQTICFNDTFDFNGQPITQTGIFTDIISSFHGCDSLIVLDLTVIDPITVNLTQTACEQFTFNTTTLFSSGTYYDTIPSVNGCDSAITLNLTIHNAQSSFPSITSCNQYIFNGNTLTSSGIYHDTLSSIYGCDSLIELNLTIHTTQTSTFAETACEQYLFNSNLLTASGTYYDTLTAFNGCDSIIELDLTIVGPEIFLLSANDCFEYNFNGTILTSTGVYTDTISNIYGCDSILILNLVLDQPNTAVNQSGITLASATSGDSYQWLDCNNSFAVINGETGPLFIAQANGSYALEIVHNGCTDTSACYTVNTFGMENNGYNYLHIFPNPTSGNIQVLFSGNLTDQTQLRLMGISGQELQLFGINSISTSIDLSSYPPGIYLLQLTNDPQGKVFRVIKN